MDHSVAETHLRVFINLWFHEEGDLHSLHDSDNKGGIFGFVFNFEGTQVEAVLA